MTCAACPVHEGACIGLWPDFSHLCDVAGQSEWDRHIVLLSGQATGKPIPKALKRSKHTVRPILDPAPSPLDPLLILLNSCPYTSNSFSPTCGCGERYCHAFAKVMSRGDCAVCYRGWPDVR